MTISVTQDHIDKGQECDCEKCPVALGFNAAGFPEVSVAPASVDFYGEDFELLATRPLPLNAIEFVVRFDLWKKKGLGRRPQPFTFEIPGLTPDLHRAEALREGGSDFYPVPVT